MKYQIPKENTEALRIIYKRLLGKGISWTIVGSTALAIHGVDIKAKDIDIQTSRENADKMIGLLKEFVVEPMHHKSDGQFKSYYGKLMINGVGIELMADLEKMVDGKWVMIESPRMRMVKRYDNITIQVFDLRDEYEAYVKIGQIEKAQKIKERLDEENRPSHRTTRAS